MTPRRMAGTSTIVDMKRSTVRTSRLVALALLLAFAALLTPAACTHATVVAWAVGGKTDGVAKRARLHSVKVGTCDEPATEADFVAGVDWVRRNAQKPAVANISMGTADDSDRAEQAVRDLIASGVYVVIAAGNEDRAACDITPARVAPAMTVGATTLIESNGPAYDQRWSGPASSAQRAAVASDAE